MRMPVTHRGLLAGRQRRVVDADLRESERIAERALLTRQHARAIGLGITGPGAWRERHRIESGFLQAHIAVPLTIPTLHASVARMPQMFDDVGEIVEEALRRVGKRVVLALPLGIGKPNLIANEFFRRARADATLDLTIFTALSLRKPTGSSALEKAFIEPLAARVFGNYPGPRLPAAARPARRVPPNVRVIEFFFEPGLAAQFRARAVALPVARTTRTWRASCWPAASMSSRTWSPSASWAASPRSASAAIPTSPSTCCRRSRSCAPPGSPVVLLGQVHREMPFMLGAAHVGADAFDLLLDHSRYDYDLFAPPNPSLVDRGSRHRPAREQPGARRRHPADRHRRARRLHRLFAAAAPPAERSLAARAHGRRHRAQRGAHRQRRRPRAVRHRPVRRHGNVRRPDARPVPRRHPPAPRLRLSTAAAGAGRERLEHPRR